ncbi:MAG TPA: hypothetical protein DEP72_02400 [Clostridiales bacterium]|nr:MAG: hypothetical protein A2Y18_01335 [Clostridiales bacterium GWD2_32_19]HCC07007.1 hypothetical protein [Clostridiales bacterium]
MSVNNRSSKNTAKISFNEFKEEASLEVDNVAKHRIGSTRQTNLVELANDENIGGHVKVMIEGADRIRSTRDSGNYTRR